MPSWRFRILKRLVLIALAALLAAQISNSWYTGVLVFTDSCAIFLPICWLQCGFALQAGESRFVHRLPRALRPDSAALPNRRSACLFPVPLCGPAAGDLFPCPPQAGWGQWIRILLSANADSSQTAPRRKPRRCLCLFSVTPGASAAGSNPPLPGCRPPDRRRYTATSGRCSKSPASHCTPPARRATA